MDELGNCELYQWATTTIDQLYGSDMLMYWKSILIQIDTCVLNISCSYL